MTLNNEMGWAERAMILCAVTSVIGVLSMFVGLALLMNWDIDMYIVPYSFFLTLGSGFVAVIIWGYNILWVD